MNESWEAFDNHFRELEDPRATVNRRHQMLDMLVITICAVLCGADDWEAVAEFGRAEKEWFARFLPLPSGIPSHDTFWRLLRRLDGAQFEAYFLRWVAEVAELNEGEVVAIDWKRVRRSHDREAERDASMLVSAWATENRLTLGQVQVAEKSNETKAIPQLLLVLDLTDCIITIDDIGCQKEIAAQIVAAEADYVLALKQHQGSLYEDATFLFKDIRESKFTAFAFNSVREVDKGHGRIEVRQCWTINDPTLLPHLRGALDWPALQSLVWIRAQRIQNGERNIVERYFIASLPGEAHQLLQAVRSHRQIENGMRWVIDFAFREDDSRLRKGHSAHNFAILRRIALNFLKQDKTTKLCINDKRLKAPWNHDYLFMLLSHLL